MNKDIAPNEIIEEVQNIDHEGALELLRDIYELELKMRERGSIGDVRIHDFLVIIPRDSIIAVIGDIHGDLLSFRYILNTIFNQDILKRGYVVFLGDYVDRGPYSVEVFLSLAKLRILYPERIFLLRGNHEPPYDLMPYPHDLPYQIVRKFGSRGKKIYEEFMKVFNELYIATIVEGRLLMVHGGVPVSMDKVEDIALAPRLHPNKPYLEEILWNDPTEDTDTWTYSPRGAGKLFGKAVTFKALQVLGVRAIVRGHEPCPTGYKFNHNGRVLTLFSRKGAPYFNEKGAFLILDTTKLSGSSNVVEVLKRSIITF